MAENSLLERLKKSAAEGYGALATGAADELSFGLSKGERSKDLEKRRPGTYMAGRIGSYLIPLPSPSKLKALGAAGRLLEKVPFLTNRGLEAAGEAVGRYAGKLTGKALAEKSIVRGAIEGGVSAGVQSKGNQVIRKAVGTSEGTEEEQNSQSLVATGTGMAGGALAKLLKRAARPIYMHEAVTNRNDVTGSERLADYLMDRGIWGTPGGLKKQADSLKRPLQDLREEVMPRAMGGEQRHLEKVRGDLKTGGFSEEFLPEKGMTNPNELNVNLRNELKRMERTGTLGREQKDLTEAFTNAKSGLNPVKKGREFVVVGKGKNAKRIPFPHWNTTSLDEVETSLKAINQDLKRLNSKKAASIFSPDAGGGEIANDIERKLMLKRALEDMQDRGLARFGNAEDLPNWRETKKTYAKGRDLTRNVMDYERKRNSLSDLGLGLGRVALGGYAAQQLSQGDPLPAILAGTAAAVSGAGGRVATRTFVGQALKRGSDKLPGKMGRIAEKTQIGKQEQEDTDDDNPYLKDLGAQAVKAEPKREEKKSNPRKVTRYPGVKDEENPYLDLIDAQ